LALLKTGERREAERLATDILATYVLKAGGRGRRKTPSLSGSQR
jgi:hypothetical protein